MIENFMIYTSSKLYKQSGRLEVMMFNVCCSSSSIYFSTQHKQSEQKWITKIKVNSYAEGYQKENNFIELATYNNSTNNLDFMFKKRKD